MEEGQARALISPTKKGKAKDEFFWDFLGKPKVESMAAFPPSLCFLQLFFFSPVGYYFLMCFDNYFKSRKVSKSLKIYLGE